MQFDVHVNVQDRSQTTSSLTPITDFLKPHWRGTQLSIKYFTAGYCNTVFLVWSSQNSEDNLLFRVFGESQNTIDRDNELSTWRTAAKYGCAVPWIGRFSNGIVSEFAVGNPLTAYSVRDETVACCVAERMAALHSIGLGDQGFESAPCLWKTIQTWIDALPTEYTDNGQQQRYITEFPSKSEIKNLLSEYRTQVDINDHDVVFAHNDLLLNNVIYDKKTETIQFIDFEYAGPNYRAFDIANHFVGFAGVGNDIDYERYPGWDYQVRWLTIYTNECKRLNSVTTTYTDEIKHLHKQVNRFAHIAQFLWSIWCVAQSQITDFDFDFLNYGIERWKQHLVLRERFRHL